MRSHTLNAARLAQCAKPPPEGDDPHAVGARGSAIS